MYTNLTPRCSKVHEHYHPMFCECGTIISLQKNSSVISCPRCRRVTDLCNLKETAIEIKIEKELEVEIKNVKGAKIKYQCPNCNAEEMMYNTAQLRSADEGQTVFYSCECGHKITVQS